MKLKRTPLILLAIAVLLGIGVYFHETRNTVQQEESQTLGQTLFPFKEEDVQSLTVKTPQQTLSFTKVAPAAPAQQPGSPPPSPTKDATWQMTSPKTTVASSASVAYLLNLLATAKREKTMTVPASRQAEFGFDVPLAVVDITLTNQKKHRLILGNPDFNRSFLYAQVDPPQPLPPELSIALVSMDFENAVKRPLTEWENQPAPLSATPSPTPTPSQPPNP